MEADVPMRQVLTCLVALPCFAAENGIKIDKTHQILQCILPFTIMKALQMGLWSIWLSGFLLIGLSLYATQRLPQTMKPNFNGRSYGDLGSPKMTIFSAPSPFAGSVGTRQSLAIRSWLVLSPEITVVLFSQDPSVSSFAAFFGSRVLVDPYIDFTFRGTPFFHSMVARSQAFTSDICVFVDSESILLPDLVQTLNFAHKLDHDWLLFASSRNVSYFPLHLGEYGELWLREDGTRMRNQKELLDWSQQWNFSEGRMLIAWNSVELPLHHGVLPPFLYGRGFHNHWLISEALFSGIRFVFDASWAISILSLDDSGHQPNWLVERSGLVDIENRNWEYAGNSHLAALYGLSSFRETNYGGVMKLLKCDGQYLFINSTDNSVHPYTYQRMNLKKEGIFHSKRLKKTMACVDGIKSVKTVLDFSFKDQLMPSRVLDFPFSLESLLTIMADKNKTIVLTVAGYSYKDMLMSWSCRLRSLSVTNFLVFALDYETYQFAILQGLPVFSDPESAPRNISFNDCHFGTKCFQRVTKVKSRMVLTILKLGYNVLLSDVDVYWFRNPLPLLSSFGPTVLAAQSDEYNETGPINLPRRLNSGFYFVRSDGPSVAALEKVVKHAATSGLSEQPSFYDVLCGEDGSNRLGDNKCVEPETNLTIHFLDRKLFPNGAYLGLWGKENVTAACQKNGCLILHNNWISGRTKKLERQVSSGLWEYDISTRMCLQSLHRTKLTGYFDI
ncbi:hypothetical protein SLA2020_402180 [Shorea laevis]